MRYRLVLGLAVALAGCSGGGNSGNPPIPVLPWGSFRHDATNSGVGSGLNNNKASSDSTSKPLVDAETLGGVTDSTIAIDANGNMFLGTTNGLLSVDSKGSIRWRVTECVLQQCAPGVPHAGNNCSTDADCGGVAGSCVQSTTPVGRVTTSPSVTPGNAVVFSTEADGEQPGAVFALKENSDNSVDCTWAFSPPQTAVPFAVRSSAATQVDSFDLSLLTTVVGSNQGRVYTINSDGTQRWTFPSGTASSDLNSSPALTFGGITYLTTPDGVLAAIDFSGRQMWRVNIGIPPSGIAAALMPSPAVSTSIYAIGGTTATPDQEPSSVLYAINPNGSLKWQYVAPIPLSGSPGYLSQSFDQGANNVLDTIVYTVDIEGTIVGIRDANGGSVQVQRCSLKPTQSCKMDSCLPDLGTCGSNGRCSLSPDTKCTPDSCPEVLQCAPGTPNAGNTCATDADCGGVAGSCVNEDMCMTITGMGVSGGVPVAGEAVPVETSLAVSGDLFAVVGTATGQVCARALDNTVPGNNDDLNNPWVAGNGCVTLGTGQPTRSSPVIGASGSIHVTTDEGLFVIQ